jgi:hypothetical protein
MEPGDLTPHGWLVIDQRNNESYHRDYGHAMQYCQDNHGCIDALVRLDDVLALIESLFEPPAGNQIGRL